MGKWLHPCPRSPVSGSYNPLCRPHIGFKLQFRWFAMNRDKLHCSNPYPSLYHLDAGGLRNSAPVPALSAIWVWKRCTSSVNGSSVSNGAALIWIAA